MMAFFILYMFNGLKLTLHLFLKNVDKNYFFSRNVSFKSLDFPRWTGSQLYLFT